MSLIGPLLAAATTLVAGAVEAAPPKHVVLVVDTSLSMARENDPRRHAVLTAMIFADLLRPEDRFDVVRFYSPEDYPNQATGRAQPCPDDPSKSCTVVEPAGDPLDSIRARRTGILSREAGPAAFKRALPGHLAYTQVDTDYDLPLRVAEMLFEEGARDGGETRRVLLFLSDGRPTNPVVQLERRKAAFQRLDARVVALGLGPEGGTAPEMQSLGIDGFHPIARAADLVAAFARVYNEILGSLHTESGALDAPRDVRMLDFVEDAYFVFYSDEEFATPRTTAPGGAPLAGSLATGELRGAGHYAVLHASLPEAGLYRVEPSAGTHGLHYALIQYFSLKPRYTGPPSARVGEDVRLTAALVAGREGSERPVTSPEVLSKTVMHLVCGGQTVELLDSGQGADDRAGDGTFSAAYRFVDVPRERCQVRARNAYIDQRAPADITVSGIISLTGPARVDFGTVKAGEEVCREALLEGQVIGDFDVSFDLLAGVPPDLGVSVAGHEPPSSLRLGSHARVVPLCLTAARSCGRIDSDTHPLRLKPSVPGGPAFPLTAIELAYRVEPLTFWERWGWLILLLLAAAFVVFVVAGHTVPARFPPTLGIVVSDREDDLHDYGATTLATVAGGKGGFWRDARVAVSDEGRVVPARQGGVLVIRAEGSDQVLVESPGARVIRRDTLSDSGWQYAVAGSETRGFLRFGELYAIEGRPLYFMLVLG